MSVQMDSVEKKYLLSFTAGALLSDESKALIEGIQDFDKFFKGKEQTDPMRIPVNSESSRKRLKAEIDRRLLHLSPAYLSFYKNAVANDEKIILFLGICKMYRIITEFCLEVMNSKWKNFDNEVSTYDFQYFLSIKLPPEQFESISEKSNYKISQVAIKMLKELGMIDEDKINRVLPSPALTELLETSGDGWFLECLMAVEQ